MFIFGAAGLFAQAHGAVSAPRSHAGAPGRPPGMTPIPGVPAKPPNILHPASGTPPPLFRHNNGFGAPVYGYPVYVPASGYGYYDNSYAAPASAPAQEGYYPPQNMTMMYAPPSYPETAESKTITNPFVDQDGDAPAPMQSDDAISKHYLLAFKDHTVYAAVAYFLQGDTIHYFTAGNIHNQASISLIDRDLTARLNKESGQQVDLPPAKN